MRAKKALQRALHLQSGLSAGYWPLTSSVVRFTMNRLPRVSNAGMVTPYEAYFGVKPDYHFSGVLDPGPIFGSINPNVTVTSSSSTNSWGMRQDQLYSTRGRWSSEFWTCVLSVQMCTATMMMTVY